MIWDNFKKHFHGSWHNKMKPFIESKECDGIYDFLKTEGRRGKQIAPSSSFTYKAFMTPLNDIKVILMSFCPYHTFVNGAPIADGLAFSCSVTGKLQPSLEKFYEGIENELFEGLNLNYSKSPDLDYLASQGVMLLNCALTVEKNKAGSHQDLWEPFTKYLMENVFAYTGIPIVFIGKDASRYKKYVTPLTHGHIFEIEHPAFAARISSTWDTKGVFGKINRIIKENNNYTVKWLCTKEEIDKITLPF